jgi:hypothetical protein
MLTLREKGARSRAARDKAARATVRANRRAVWSKQIRYSFEGTYLQVETTVLGSWIITDTRDPFERVAGPFLSLTYSRRAAERLVEREPDRYRVRVQAKVG